MYMNALPAHIRVHYETTVLGETRRVCQNALELILASVVS